MRSPSARPAVGRAGMRFLAVAISLLLPFLLANHWSQAGWRDKHYRYPSRPSGYSQIVSRFGQPCNSNASAISMQWVAGDTGQTYTPRFHRKLGGYPTEMVADKGGKSTNLDNDVYGHIQNAHLQPYVEAGIWGYFCRYIDGTTSWSTHAFGIAIDVSAVEEWNGKCNSTVNYRHARIWQNHRWYWGLAFCDPMHFQYATGY